MTPEPGTCVSKSTELSYNNHFWCAKSPTEVQRILSYDFQKSNEFVIAEHILVWITNQDAISVIKETGKYTHSIYKPQSAYYNKEYANEVIRCVRPEGLCLFYNYYVMIPWLNKLELRFQELESQDYDDFSSEDENSENNLFIHVRKVKQKRVIGFSSSTILPVEVLEMTPGVYTLEEPCLYCDDYSESEDEESRPLSVVKMTLTVDPENSHQPLVITGRCHPVDGRQEFYHHTIEHCVVDPHLSAEHCDTFVSLYCTSYWTLHQHFQELKRHKDTGIKLLIFYSIE